MSFIFIITYSLSAETALHEIGNNCGVIPNVGILGVGGVTPDLLIAVPKSTTNSLGETNLLTRLKEVLTLENILGGELPEILSGGYLTGKEG
jgi:hypothetical protein|tara:strand:- start:7113 stop:7388 length:276 start_codon:yes stop_codon:yes gene_type:complete